MSALLNGILVVYKPPYRITNPFINDLKRKFVDIYNDSHPFLLSRKDTKKILGKVGHCGTLDPMAQGILVLGLGSETKTLSSLLKGSKSYTATMKLGETTDTLDATGANLVKDTQLQHDLFHRNTLEPIFNSFVGENIHQVPPKFCALKIQGNRACDLLRQGYHIPDFPPRPVTISRIEIAEIDPPFITFKVDCMGGTYIRSLARDIANKLGTVGMLTFLERTAVGLFLLKDSIKDLDFDFEQLIMLSRKNSALLSDYLNKKNGSQFSEGHI